MFQIDATRKPRYEAALRNGTLTSRIMALILGLTVGVSQTKADVIIDNFTGTNSPATSGTPPVLFTTGPGSWAVAYVYASPTNVNGTVTEAASIPGVISGWGRSVSFTAPNGGNGVSGAFPVEGAVNLNLLAVNTGAPTNMTLTYQGATENFTGATGFLFDFNSIDHAGSPLSITITDAKGSTETGTEFINFTGPGSVLFPVGSLIFTTGGGEGSFNWGADTQFVATLDGGQDLNYRLDLVAAIDPPVPEPSALAIWVVTAAIGGLALMRVFRTRRQTAAAEPVCIDCP